MTDEQKLAIFDRLFLACHNLMVSANTVRYCYERRPENFAGALIEVKVRADDAREVLGQIRGQP